MKQKQSMGPGTMAGKSHVFIQTQPVNRKEGNVTIHRIQETSPHPPNVPRHRFCSNRSGAIEPTRIPHLAFRLTLQVTFRVQLI